MRQVHQLAQVLALILFKKRENPEVDSTETIDSGLRDGLGLSLEEVLTSDKHRILQLCHQKGHFYPDLAVAVADLLFEEGSEEAAVRALWLYSAALEAGGTLPINAIEWVSANPTAE